MSDMCCGCNACISVCSTGAIREMINSKGFYSAEIDKDKCVGCNECSEVCPFEGSREEHELMMPFGFRLSNIGDRFNSQSGGAFYSFACQIISEGGIVYGVGFDGEEAVYRRICSTEQLVLLTGSKYIQAKMENIVANVEKDLKNNKLVLFSGSSCHISGLKKYLHKKNMECKRLILIDFVCHGTPSPLVFKLYKKMLEQKYGDIKSFNFRDKTIGWHGHICSFEVDKEKYYSRDYVDIFYSNACLNDCCYSCRFANLNREGDITIADLWGCEKAYPQLDDNIGTSLVIINTTKGDELKSKTEKNGVYLPIEIEECYQKNLYEPTNKPDFYDEFWKSINRSGLKKTVHDLFGIEYSETQIGELFWSDYDIKALVNDLRGNVIYLYGIGAPLVQLLELLRTKKCDVKGILDKTCSEGLFSGKDIVSIEEVRKIPESIIVICSRNVNSILAICDRLKKDIQYKNMRIVSLDKYLLD